MSIADSLKKRKTILWVIILTAFLIRFSFVGSMDFYTDANVDSTRLFVGEGISPWIGTAEQPPVLTWMSAIFVKIFGFSEFSMRLVSVLLGTFTVILIYYLSRLWYGPKHALLSALLLAVIPIHIIYSRVAYREAVQTFFLVGAIFFMELVQNEKIKARYAGLCFAGILFALSFLTKYNAVIIWGIYCTFLIWHSWLDKNKLNRVWKIFKELVVANLAALIFIIFAIVLPTGISRMIHVAYNIFDWSIRINAGEMTNPAYHYFLILFDALSPLLYFVFVLSAAYLIFLAFKKRCRADILLMVLFFVYFIIINIQSTKYSKYLVLVIPFMAIIMSRFLMNIHKKSRSLFIPIVLILVFSATGWSMYEIAKYNDYTVWNDMGDYINNNFPEDTVVYVNDFFYHHAKNYIDNNLNFSRGPFSLKEGDLVILNWVLPGSIIRTEDPLGQSIINSKKHLPLRYDYVMDYNSNIYPLIKDDKLVGVFGNGKVNSTWLFQITEPKFIGVEFKDEGGDHFSRHSKIWGIICKTSFIKNAMFRFLSERQTETIQGNCR
jgi:hypothetical protein|tara:strand:- start:21 stop:1667 length:1647 start_codon:yes stop_codon:yes gene_type:complete